MRQKLLKRQSPVNAFVAMKLRKSSPLGRIFTLYCLDSRALGADPQRKNNASYLMRTNSLLLSLVAGASLFSFVAAAADDSEALIGKWSVKKVNDEGQNVTQTLTIKKGKGVFQMVGAEDRTILYAEGDVKLDKIGPFNALHFANVRGGTSADNLQDVDDEYVSVYLLDGDTLTMATSFDKDREQIQPSVDVYHRVKEAAGATTLVIDEVAMADTPQSSTWFVCFEAKVEGVSKTYHVDGKSFDKNQVTIPVALELPNVKAGQKCSFKLQLDDADEDACGESADNSSKGEFTVSDKGSQDYKPEDNWKYTIKWHLK